MSHSNIYPVVMAGGAGTRFWPASRKKTPKQLLPLVDDKSLYRLTIDRLKKRYSAEQIRILTPPHLEEPIRDRSPELPDESFLHEPQPRDTAACIGLAAFHLHETDPEAGMLVLPSDQLIPDDEAFLETIQAASAVLTEQPESLITFGVEPDEPATGYGYIKTGEWLFDQSNIGVYRTDEFREKPDRETAQAYLSEGGYLWNSGIFLWNVRVILDQLQTHAPDIYDGLAEYMDARTEQPPESSRRMFGKIPQNSIDYAVMEQTGNVLVVEASFDWTDVGTWNSLMDINKRDDRGNVVRGRGFLKDTQNCVIYEDNDDHLVAGLGIENLVVVVTEDATLVCPLERVQDVKQLVSDLEEENLDDYL